ncbi:MAG: Crp/Fnr family transcriptional regulator [Epsilonproteobacteria bacterium]|jgi:CRP/FNR family transcriptional regulator|nr:Crp/Fnr family transcriptional regulator [Campylobacterota bacterium]NPA89518.1 Crp/Fnr family transcriptional regulator [Campylobacterota bacterium]
MELEQFFLFHGLDKEVKEGLRSAVKVKEFKKGSILFLEGDEPRYLHLLLEGEAQVFKSTPRGREIVIHTFSAPSLIGELANLKNIPFPASCKMISDGKVGFLEFQKVQKYLKKEGLCFHLMESLLRKMQFLDNLIHNSLLLDTETRIAKLIYENPELFEKLKQHQIASILNIKPETLSRKLLKFKELGIIGHTDGKLRVLNISKIPEYFQW